MWHVDKLMRICVWIVVHIIIYICSVKSFVLRVDAFLMFVYICNAYFVTNTTQLAHICVLIAFLTDVGVNAGS